MNDIDWGEKSLEEYCLSDIDAQYGGDDLDEIYFNGKRFMTNFRLEDYDNYAKAITEFGHTDMLELRNVDCWGGRDENMGSLYCSDELEDLTLFWRIFDKVTIPSPLTLGEILANHIE